MSPVCKQCGQPISGRYITALGAAWHPEHFVCAACHKPINDAGFNAHEGRPYHSECYLQHVAPRCDYCGKPLLGQYQVHDGKSYHPECFLNHVAPRCEYCDKPLLGQYQVYQGKSYHPECFRDHIAPRCDYCGKPLLGQYQTYQGKSYHPECFRDHVAPRCVYCGKPLTGEYMVNYWGEHYCKEHQKQYPACAFCGRLVPPQQQEVGPNKSGSVRCPICRANAIGTMNQAQPVFAHLQQWMSDNGMMYNSIPLSLELCDRAKLNEYMGDHSEPHMLGITMSTTHTVDGQEVRTEVDRIAVLSGMPTMLFQGVTIHELGHAWLVIQGIKGLPPWAEEGFCELLSYRYYAQLNTPESRYHVKSIVENLNPIYGEGFRLVRSIADRMGFQRFVEALRTTKKLPTG